MSDFEEKIEAVFQKVGRAPNEVEFQESSELMSGEARDGGGYFATVPKDTNVGLLLREIGYEVRERKPWGNGDARLLVRGDRVRAHLRLSHRAEGPPEHQVMTIVLRADAGLLTSKPKEPSMRFCAGVLLEICHAAWRPYAPPLLR
jgi:hypothetical protein